jgi:peptidoglycan/LPS O-acetylase OafA/YrhL
MQSKPQEIKALSGARALPALMIVLFHFYAIHRYVPAAAVLYPPVTKGYLWVEFFFALSGFLLIHVYGPRAAAFRWAAYLAFLKARLTRLYPLHLFTLLSMLGLGLVLARHVLSGTGGIVAIFFGPDGLTGDGANFLASLFMVQAWNILPGLGWNVPAWFVSIEFLLCLVFPLFLFLSRGGAWRGTALIAAGSVWLILLAWNSGVGLDITFKNGMFRGMAGFAIGAGMAMVFRAAPAKGLAGIAEWKHSAVQGALLLFVFWAIYYSGPGRSRADLWTALALDSLILALAFDRGFLARFLALPVLLKLGEWSFAIYLGQMFCLQIEHHMETYHLLPGAAMYWLSPLVVLLICIAWGALLARFVEQPASVFLKRILAPRKPNPA